MGEDLEPLATVACPSVCTLVITVVMFPAAPLALIQDAVRQVFAALRDTLARPTEFAGTGRTTPGREWALAVGQRTHRASWPGSNKPGRPPVRSRVSCRAVADHRPVTLPHVVDGRRPDLGEVPTMCGI